jgi:hypothetical protein
LHLAAFLGELSVDCENCMAGNGLSCCPFANAISIVAIDFLARGSHHPAGQPEFVRDD